MKISDKVVGDVAVIHLGGKVMGGADATMFHGKMHEIIAAGRRKIVIDLAKVDWMDSVGIGMLVMALTTTANNNAEMRLANVTGKVLDLIAMVKLLKIFKVHDSVDDAIKSF